MFGVEVMHGIISAMIRVTERIMSSFSKFQYTGLVKIKDEASKLSFKLSNNKKMAVIMFVNH